MNNKEVKTWHILFFMSLMCLMIFMIYDKPEIVYNDSTETCKTDSLLSVINNQKIEYELLENGFDSKEKRYEEIIFEYEYGVNRLKETHIDAYKEFHRIIGYKERFSVDVERENKKRLQYCERTNL